MRPLSLAEVVAAQRSEDLVAKAFHEPTRACAPSGMLNGAKATRSLTAEQVQEIRRRAAAGEKQADLAKAFGVESTTIRLVVQRKTYGWVR